MMQLLVVPRIFLPALAGVGGLILGILLVLGSATGLQMLILQAASLEAKP